MAVAPGPPPSPAPRRENTQMATPPSIRTSTRSVPAPGRASIAPQAPAPKPDVPWLAELRAGGAPPACGVPDPVRAVPRELPNAYCATYTVDPRGNNLFALRVVYTFLQALPVSVTPRNAPRATLQTFRLRRNSL